MLLGEQTSVEYRTRRDFCKLVSSQIGTPYVWAGNNPETGFDCSGLVVWALRQHGLLRPRDDLTAQRLADLSTQVPALKRGDLVFYGRDWGRVTHVTIYIGMGYLVGASRGNRNIRSKEQARLKKAAVRTLDLDYRTRDRLGFGRLINPKDDPNWRPLPLNLEVRK